MTRQDILRLFCFGFEGDAVTPAMQRYLADGLRAVILFARNLRDLPQIHRLTAELGAAGARLIGADQEGGRVVRLPAPFTVPPPAAALGARRDPDLARRLALAIGTEMRAAGFTWNLVPVLDVHSNPANPIIGDRAFGSDPGIVAQLGVAVMRGFAEAGILTTAKHFPGHGDSAADSHLTLPVCGQDRARWEALELLPFRVAIAAGVPAIMIAHLACPALDPDVPTSLSPAVIGGILRDQLGFDGVIVCDDLEMQAIAGRFSVGEAAVRFLQAGGDLILICRREDYQAEAVLAVEEAARSGALPPRRIEESLERLEAATRQVGYRPPHSLAALKNIAGSAGHLQLVKEALQASV